MGAEGRRPGGRGPHSKDKDPLGLLHQRRQADPAEPLELVKKPASCLEFILVHELIHSHERRHNERFGEWMDQLMPQWRRYREALNRAALAQEDWRY